MLLIFYISGVLAIKYVPLVSLNDICLRTRTCEVHPSKIAHSIGICMQTLHCSFFKQSKGTNKVFFAAVTVKETLIYGQERSSDGGLER